LRQWNAQEPALELVILALLVGSCCENVEGRQSTALVEYSEGGVSSGEIPQATSVDLLRHHRANSHIHFVAFLKGPPPLLLKAEETTVAARTVKR
jgi:hypothetical protein